MTSGLSSPIASPFETLPTGERPEVLEMSVDGADTLLRLRLPDHLPWFDGHFPGRPILPGVAHVHLAGIAALSILAPQDSVVGTGRLKFQRPLLPDDVVTLTLRPVKTGVGFEFATTDAICSSGSLKLAGSLTR